MKGMFFILVVFAFFGFGAYMGRILTEGVKESCEGVKQVAEAQNCGMKKFVYQNQEITKVWCTEYDLNGKEKNER